MAEELLKISGLKKAFGKLEVLKGLTTTIRKGEVVVMIGLSGGGKSTFLRCMNLLEQPTEGTIVFDGIDIVSADEKTKNKVTHEMRFARDVASRVLFLEGGRIAEEGTPQEVFGNPKCDRLKEFLGKVA